MQLLHLAAEVMHSGLPFSEEAKDKLIHNRAETCDISPLNLQNGDAATPRGCTFHYAQLSHR